MCVAVPGRVLEIAEGALPTGRVEVLGVPRMVNLGLLEEVRPGDWVLVQVGFAVEKIDEAQARETMALLEEMSAAYEAELAAAVEEER